MVVPMVLAGVVAMAVAGAALRWRMGGTPAELNGEVGPVRPPVALADGDDRGAPSTSGRKPTGPTPAGNPLSTDEVAPGGAAVLDTEENGGAKGEGEMPRSGEAPAKKARAFGTVNINASPWADVRIDGVDYTSTPILGLKLRAGKHKATFVNPELGVTKTETFVIKPNETVRLVVEME